MNPGVIWELVRPTHLLPALKKGVRKKTHRPPAPPEDASRDFLLGEGVAGVISSRTPPRPPRGFLAVYVGPDMKRFVIPASYLCLPAFRGLMEQAAEEFGFDQEGALQIPCDEAAFEEILRRAAAVERAAGAGGKGGRKTNKVAAAH